MTDYPRCKTCKWWGKVEWNNIEIDPACYKLTTTIAPGAPTAGIMGYSLPAVFQTAPDFGCVYHEEKK